MTSSLTVGELTRGVKGVQDAKASLEHRLNDRRSKRKEAERILESVNVKFSQVKHLHSKMMEAVKVAQHKVSQTQAQSSSNEENNKQKNQMLQKLGEQIKEGNEDRTADIMKFEEELSKLSSFLVDAKDVYTDKKLQDSMLDANNNAVETQNQLPELEEEETDITLSLQSLSIDASENRETQIDKENIWSLISEEQNAALECLQSLNDEIATLSSHS